MREALLIPAVALALTSTFVATSYAQPGTRVVPSGPAYRFEPEPLYQPRPQWGYIFGGRYVYSPAFSYYAPGYVTGAATGAPPTGGYYASPCYIDRQQVWDGARWSMRRVRICR